jgi:hypothetical protein
VVAALAAGDLRMRRPGEDGRVTTVAGVVLAVVLALVLLLLAARLGLL